MAAALSRKTFTAVVVVVLAIGVAGAFLVARMQASDGAALMGSGPDAATQERFVKSVVPELRRADMVELLSLSPEPMSVDDEATLRAGGKLFMGRWRILGRAILSGDERSAVVNCLERCVKNSRTSAMGCFRPRHAIRSAGKIGQVEAAICFECLQIDAVVNGGGIHPTIEIGDAQDVLDRILSKASVPLATKPGQ